MQITNSKLINMRLKFKWILALLVAFSMQLSFAQEKTVTGVVTDATGPLPGVNVLVKGTRNGVQTNLDGKYSIKAKTGDVLVFSFVGMTETTKAVGASNTVNVAMKDGVSLNEVIVQTNLGYFSKDSRKLSSSVSTVSAEEITRQSPTLTVQNALQGQAAGVQVTQANGKPGAAATVTVRGAVSITGETAQAVYVVDGAFVSGTEASALNANDVESVSVLKDGASAALYGIRGGNGVIVITTKKGKNGKAKFAFNSSIGFSQKIKDPFTMMNTDEKLRYETLLGQGGSFPQTPAKLALLRSYDHNWQDDLLQKGFVQNSNFSYSGGNDQFTNFMSVGYTEDTGIISKLKGFNRITARYNSEYKANETIKFGFNVGGSYEKFNDSRDRNNAQSPIRAMYDYNPYEPFYARDAAGNITFDPQGNPNFNTNLIAGFPIQEAIVNNTEQRRFFRLYGRPYVEIGIAKDLKFKTQMNMNYERYQRESFTKPNSFLDQIVGDPAARGSKTDNGWDSLDYQLTNSLSYKYSINNKHNFSGVALYEYYKTNFRSYSLDRKGFINGDLPTGGSTILNLPGTTRSENATLSALVSIDYDYDNKYLLAVYGRRDGSSVLGTNNKYSYAKGASIGWNVTRESFMSDVKWLNNLKLRASYGELNSTNGIGSYDAQSLFGSSQYGGAIGSVVRAGVIGNPNLKFEKALKSEVGVEVAVLNNWLTFSSSVFQDKRKDFIYTDTAPVGTAFASLINAGDWTSKGAEIELKAFAIKNANTTLSFYANAAVFDRKINTLNRPGDPNNQLSRGLTYQKVGLSPDNFFLVNYAGVDPTNGHALYTKLDGTKTDVYSAGDRVFTGKTPYAKYEGGFGMQFAYKGFDISTDFVFKQGNYIYNYMWANMTSGGTNVFSNQASIELNYWTPTNTTASQPAPRQLSGIVSSQVSDRYLEDGSYIRFRNLNVGYKFTKKAWTALPVDEVRIFTTMQNLFTWSKFNGDPEVGIGSAEAAGLQIPGAYALYSYPSVQQFIFGLSINL